MAEGDSTLTRRGFVRTVGAAAIVGAVGKGAGAGDAGPDPGAAAETAVARFYRSLKDDQKQVLCFPFDHPLRARVDNNWAVVEPTIDDLSGEQRALCREVFRNLCSEDGHARFLKQMGEDGGGFGGYHVAVFGEPGTDRPFEWVMTGRHVTLRADGNSVDGAAFGGPIFYGHAAGTFYEDARHTGNVWWHQAERANKVFAALDDKQKARALVARAEPDEPRSTRLRGEDLGEPGLPVADLDGPQQAIVRSLLDDLLSPFRAFDADEVRSCLRDAGGLGKLRLTFFQQGDTGDDGVWDVWKLEGPAFAWYFHGSPHVHAWLNVARRAPGA